MADLFKKPADNSVKSVDNLIKPAEFRVSKIFRFLARLKFVLVDFFFWFSPIFSEFLKMWRIC
jgi:hypothetical protein